MPGAPRCTICSSPISPDQPSTRCPSCRTPFHSDCWSENGGCAVYGCSRVPATEARGGLEIPPAYWGQDNKPCPACGATILAAAVRCRTCGATFDSARPESVRDFHRRQSRTREVPALRKGVIALFVFTVLPCTAPLAAVLGLLWFYARRDELQALPAVYQALCRIGLVVGFGQTVVAILAAVLYGLFRQPL